MELEAKLLSTFATKRPLQVARALESMTVSDAAEVIGEAPTDASTELLRWLSPLVAAKCLELLPIETAVDLILRARRDVAATILRSTHRTRRIEMLESLPPEARHAIKRLLRYPQNTAGALMDSQALSFPATISAGEALERLKQAPQHALYYLYIVSDDQKLIGVVNMRQLLEARPSQVLGLIALRTVDTLAARSSGESVLVNPGWKRVHALPVVEADGRFVGVVRYESLRMLEAQLTESSLQEHAETTSSAVGELYGVGLRGVLEWAASAVFGAGEAQSRQP